MHRRRVALASMAVLLGGPLLAACGFDYPTDRVNTNAAGVTDRQGVVDVVGVNVVAGADGAGNVIGTLSNGGDSSDALVDVEGADGADISAVPFEPVALAASGSDASFVNLADLVTDGDPVSLTGDFGAGEVVPLTFTFSDADPITVDVPVLKPCFQYEGLDASASADPSEEPSSDASDDGSKGDKGGDKAGDDASDEPSAPSSSESTSSDDQDLAGEPEAAYQCDQEPAGSESSGE